MKTIKTYLCWKKDCGRSKETRLKKSELIKRKEDKNHTDYVCPDCDSVIICEVKN